MKLRMAMTQRLSIPTFALTTTQHLNTMLFDSPEMRELIEQDNQFLALGKADWDSRILALANDIIYCQKCLYSTAHEFGIDPVHDNSFEEITQHYTKQLSNLKEQLLHLTDKAIIDKIESLANNVKDWKERELTREEKERNNKIIHNNHLLAKAKFLSLLSNIDDSTKTLIKEHENLEYKRPIPPQYPWEHVALSMLRFPDKVIFNYDRCPDCGHSRICIFFYSPECTWAMMCGVGGNMVICHECKIQAEFKVTIRN